MMGAPETTPVYPVSTIPGNAAPPPYTMATGAAPIGVEMQMQPIVVQPAYQPAYIGQGTTVVHAQVVQPATTATVVTVVSVKRTENDKPYLEFCPRCQTTVTTRTVLTVGACWWIICFIGFFLICWPILFCLCCAGSKDVRHYCPNCASYLAIKKRGC